MRRIGLQLLIVVLVFFSVYPALAESFTVTDMAGRKVTVSNGPRRIVCLGPGALRLIVYLNAADRVVGVEEIEKRRVGGRPYALAHPELARLPRIGPGGPSGTNQKPDMEALITVKPQVIFVAYLEDAQADTLQQTLGIPVVVLRYGSSAIFDDAAFDSIMLAGKVLGSEARARQVLDFINTLRTDLRKRTSNLPANRKANAYVGGVSYRGSFGIESTERNYVPMLWANVNNISERVETKLGSHVFLDKEKLLSLDPDNIFIDGGGLALILEDYRKHAEFYRSLGAFKKRRVFALLPFNSYATNIETALADAYAVGKVFYPERFADIDPEAKTDEIYRFFVGKPVYKAMKVSFAPIGSIAPFWKEPSSTSNK